MILKKERSSIYAKVSLINLPSNRFKQSNKHILTASSNETTISTQFSTNRVIDYARATQTILPNDPEEGTLLHLGESSSNKSALKPSATI